MSAVNVAVGQAFTLDAREAAAEAVIAALRDYEGQSVSLAMIFASTEYDFDEIVSGALAQLGDTPLIGSSTAGEITAKGSHRRSVVVVLLGVEDVQAKAAWVPGVVENTLRTAEQMIQALSLSSGENGLLMLVGDGISGDGDVLSKSFPGSGYQFFGCMSGGDLRQNRSFQIGGAQAGTGGLAGALLKSNWLKAGTGVAHGWESVGAYFKISTVRGPWVRFLDGKPASESYAEMFGKAARDWSFPPLDTLVRLYPLGIEQEEGDELVIRTPMRVEADGSLKMSTMVPSGVVGHLMVGGTERCLDAARKAARQALDALGSAKPRLALVFADLSWEMLLKSRPGAEIQAVREVLGKNVPIAGGYTFGQIAQLNGDEHPNYLNQHIEVVVLGEMI